MSGHSKWATIRRDKEANDAKKGAIFTKLSKDISTYAKAGGGDPVMNASLAIAISKAKAANMPSDKIQKAIDKGLGVTKSGAVLHEVSYEAYAPGDVGMIIDVSTDNKNRTLGEVRSMIEKSGGRFVEGGAVSWLFESKGWISLPFETEEEKKKREGIKWGEKAEVKKINPSQYEEFELELIDQDGLLDIQKNELGIDIYTVSDSLGSIRKFIEQKEIFIEDAEIVKKPKTEMTVDDEVRERIETLVSNIEEHDDVKDVWIALG